MVMNLLKVIIDFSWSMLNYPLYIDSTPVTTWAVISFGIVLGLFWRLIFGGVKNDK